MMLSIISDCKANFDIIQSFGSFKTVMASVCVMVSRVRQARVGYRDVSYSGSSSPYLSVSFISNLSQF